MKGDEFWCEWGCHDRLDDERAAALRIAADALSRQPFSSSAVKRLREMADVLDGGGELSRLSAEPNA